MLHFLVFSLVSDVLRFDNTYSWTHSKELYYLVRVMPPDTDICPPREPEVNGDIFVDCKDS